MELVLSREAASIEKTGHASAVSEEQAMIDELFMFGWSNNTKIKNDNTDMSPSTVVAGHETTATTLSCILSIPFPAHEPKLTIALGGLKYLSRHPQIQTRLRSDLLSAYGTHTPTLSQIIHTSIPLLDATAHEMLRLSRTVSAAVRVATVDTQILGHHIPKGNSVIVLLNGWSSLGGGGFDVDEEVRGVGVKGAGKEKTRSWDDGDIGDFRPERWLVADGPAPGNFMFDQNAGPAMPMSAGPRGCFGTSRRFLADEWTTDIIQGKRLAHLELRLAIVTLVLAFEFLSVPSVLDTDKATEVMTRQPDNCFVRLGMAV